MTWIFQENRLGLQPVEVTSTVQNADEGTVTRAYDSAGTYGGGEFIYLKGVDSTVVGSLVTYNMVSHVTTLSANTANQNSPVAVAMSANVTGSWGWYQIGGAAVIKKTAVKVSPSVPLYQSGTTGRVMSTAASGKQLVNARSANVAGATVASATSTITAIIDRPFLQGAVA
jgi:hypothetical protein